MTGQQTVWTVTEYDGRHGTRLRGIYATKDDARLALRAIHEAEEGAGGASRNDRTPRAGLHEGGWGVSDGRGTTYYVDPMPVQTMPTTRTERRLTCTECGAVSTWITSDRVEQKWRDQHMQGGPDHGDTTTETREVRL